MVLDTNVLLSAMMSDRGALSTIYRAWRSGHFELVTSRHQLTELRRASRYPKLRAILQPARVGTMINNIQDALVHESLPNGFEAKDPDDAFLLGMASVGQVLYLVTGDHKAGLSMPGAGVTILTPVAFCEMALS